MSNVHGPIRYDSFITPIWHFPNEGRIDTEALEVSVRQERQRDPEGVRISNQGGWQSRAHLVKSDEFASLREYIVEKTEQVCAEWQLDFGGHKLVMNTMWANINQGRDVNHMHHHWQLPLQYFNVLSGAYYVKCDATSGVIKFFDDRPSAKYIILEPFMLRPNRFTGRAFKVQPKIGDLLMFPSWLDHEVSPNENDDERISISFNMSIPPELVDRISSYEGDS